MSHNLQSEPHTTHTAVLPNPPQNLSIVKVDDNDVTLTWLPPANSLFTEYVIRYKPFDDGTISQAWSEVTDVPRNATTYVLKDLPPGWSLRN